MITYSSSSRRTKKNAFITFHSNFVYDSNMAFMYFCGFPDTAFVFSCSTLAITYQFNRVLFISTFHWYSTIEKAFHERKWEREREEQKVPHLNNFVRCMTLPFYYLCYACCAFLCLMVFHKQTSTVFILFSQSFFIAQKKFISTALHHYIRSICVCFRQLVSIAVPFFIAVIKYCF